jgi:hypothetical protein
MLHSVSRLQPFASSQNNVFNVKKSSDVIRKRTRDLPACSIVPQPTTLNKCSFRITGFSDFVHRLDCKELEEKYDVTETGSVSVLG